MIVPLLLIAVECQLDRVCLLIQSGAAVVGFQDLASVDQLVAPVGPGDAFVPEPDLAFLASGLVVAVAEQSLPEYAATVGWESGDAAGGSEQ